MRKEKKGTITLYLALTLGVMMCLIFTLIEAVRIQTIQMETESVMDIGLYSVFGEYHRQLLEQYDLFFIDTTYGEGSPLVKRSEEHLQYYMNQNFKKGIGSDVLGFCDLTALNCDNVTFDAYMYASDDNASVLKAQMIEYMKHKNGLQLMEDILSDFKEVNPDEIAARDMEGEWEAAQEEVNRLVEEKRKEFVNPETGEELPIEFDNPANHVKGMKGQGILGLAFPKEKEISAAYIRIQDYLSHREVKQGIGKLSRKENLEDKIMGKEFLLQYLFEKCSYYDAIKEKSLLKYQIEYLLYGKESDILNLQETLKHILQIRQCMNFTYLISDAGKVKEAEVLAWVVSAVLASPELKEAVKFTILYAWNYAESVKDIRILLDGNKVPMLKNSENWNTPLSQLLTFTSHLGEYKTSDEGIDYQKYLRFFLSLKSEKEILYRFMDICEMDIRRTEGNEYFQMDGCISAVKAKANVSSRYGYGYEITRTFTY